MTCSRCGDCCKWLVIDVALNLASAKTQADNLIIEISENKQYSDDEKQYFKLRHVLQIQEITNAKDKVIQTKLNFINLHRSKTKFEVLDKFKTRIFLYMPCKELTDDNLCAIFEDRPNVCRVDKTTLDLWFPDSCTKGGKKK